MNFSQCCSYWALCAGDQNEIRPSTYCSQWLESARIFNSIADLGERQRQRQRETGGGGGGGKVRLVERVER